MNWLEAELKQALERKEPSPDFASRVAAAARSRRVFRMPRWMPAAAAFLIITGGGIVYRHHEGEVAKQQVMLAMRITANKLNHIQAHVKEVAP